MNYSRSGDRCTLELGFDEMRALLAVLHFAEVLSDHAINPQIPAMIRDFARQIDSAIDIDGGDRRLLALLPEETT
jgi:hypothetical protein